MIDYFKSWFVQPYRKEVEDILEIMGNVFYDFGLYSDKVTFMGRYQLPLRIVGSPIIVGGWLKLQLDTRLLPKAVFREDLEDKRLLTALQSALGRNVEFRYNEFFLLQSLLTETVHKDKKSRPAKHEFEFWYLVELDIESLRSIPRKLYLDLLPAPLSHHHLTWPFGAVGSESFMMADFPSEIISLLIAGATRQGKSTYLKSCLEYLQKYYSSSDYAVLLADFKTPPVDFKQYVGQSWFSLITSPDDLLSEVIYERDRRAALLGASTAINIFEYNKVNKPLPYLVVIIDEFAAYRLMLSSKYGKGSNDKLFELLTLVSTTASAGIYWVIATQQPSVEVVPSALKINMVTRACFSVPSSSDAATIFGVDSDFAEFPVNVGCPGRFFCIWSDKFFEAQSVFV